MTTEAANRVVAYRGSCQRKKSFMAKSECSYIKDDMKSIDELYRSNKVT